MSKVRVLQDESDLELLKHNEVSIGFSFRELANIGATLLLFSLGYNRLAYAFIIIFIIGIIVASLRTTLQVEARKELKQRGYR